MSPRDTKTVKIPVDDAYGPHQEDLVVEVTRCHLPPDLDPAVGDQLQMMQQSGRPVVVTVTGATEESLTLDANHPLAGEDLTFDIELVEIN